MKAFHGSIELKEKILKQLVAHYEADEIIKGQYWENGKGCAIGCTLHSADHSLGEKLYGIPEVLWRLEDSIFESLENKLAKKFPIEFIEAIPVGANLDKVFYKFSVAMLERVINYTNSESAIKAIQQVVTLFKRKVQGLEVNRNEWRNAAAANAANAAAANAANAAATNAYAAATNAAYAAATNAAYAAATNAANAAATAAATAATNAAAANAAATAATNAANANAANAYAANAYAANAYAAANAANAANARQKERKAQRDTLLTLLKESK
jgi:hypothetical protein